MKIDLAVLGIALAVGGTALAGPAKAQQQLNVEVMHLRQNLIDVIKQTQADAKHRQLSQADMRSLIQEAVRAAIIQSGGEPQAVLSALGNLPADLVTSQAVKAAIETVKAEVADLAAKAEDVGTPGAAGAPTQAPSILSAPPPSAGGGGGGGSDYRPG